MASSEVDQKFLGRLARAVEPNNALLGSMLFKILGLSINLAEQTVRARKQRRLDTTRATSSLNLYLHIIWMAREGLVMLEQYVLPMVGDYVELKVLAHKLRASFYHIFVLFHNNPPVSAVGVASAAAIADAAQQHPGRLDKGKAVDRGESNAADATTDTETTRSSLQPTHALELPAFPPQLGGPVGPPPGFGPGPRATTLSEPAATFLLPAVDYLPLAHGYFKEAAALADGLLWDSHSLRLSVKTEYAAFLYECVHDRAGSRRLAQATIQQVYEASEGMDDDMFGDACELVTVLGKMVKRGLGGSRGSKGTLRSGVAEKENLSVPTSSSLATVVPAAGMENAI
ncbi:14-3-3 domain-containing protein [Xylariomycetidae sp. FL0641]|nr:14-3-3 domain-containing protein [Xylariomycetidae sp. FL0641]